MTAWRPATAGSLLDAAVGQLTAVGQQRPSRAEVREASAAAGLVLASLARYLGDSILAGRWPQEAGAARGDLDRSARLLTPPGAEMVARRPVRRGPSAQALSSAAGSLTAARDLLHTHFTPTPGGRATHRSPWAAVIESPEVARALAAEVVGCARQLEALAATWVRAASTWPEFAVEAQAFAAACHSLRAAGQAVGGALVRDPVTPADRVLLYAIPVNAPIPPLPPQAAQSVTSISRATVLAAERARQAAWAPRPAWSAGNSDTSLLRTAAAVAVVAHNCELALDMLTGRARQLGHRELADALTSAGDAAFTARSRWMDVAQRWNGHMVTATAAPEHPAGTPAAVGELAVWSGRLVFDDPAWTPERGQHARLRPPEELADGEQGMGQAAAAVHHTADALQRIAEGELIQAQALAAGGELYVPARSLPLDQRVAGLYCPAPPSAAFELVRAYQDAESGGADLAATMDLAAAEARAPSQVLALARAATGRSAEPDATDADTTVQEIHSPAGPVTRMLKDTGAARPELLAMAGQLDTAAPDPGAIEQQAGLRQAHSRQPMQIEAEAGG